MLSELLVTEIFAFLLIFARVGSGLMVLPGIGENYVSPRIRLTLALAIALIVTPMLSSHIPPAPTQPSGLALMLLLEILLGLFFGVFARMLITAMQVASTAIAYQSGLASALTTDVLNGGQGTTMSNLLATGALILLFILDLHHLMLRGIVASYQFYTPGTSLPVEDMATMLINTFNQAFRIALQLASPHIVIGLIMYLGAGVLSRLMPQMQIFFVLLPLQIFSSFSILIIVITGMMLWYMQYIEESLMYFVP